MPPLLSRRCRCLSLLPSTHESPAVCGVHTTLCRSSAMLSNICETEKVVLGWPGYVTDSSFIVLIVSIRRSGLHSPTVLVILRGAHRADWVFCHVSEVYRSLFLQRPTCKRTYWDAATRRTVVELCKRLLLTILQFQPPLPRASLKSNRKHRESSTSSWWL
jgi:hypothetical protein